MLRKKSLLYWLLLGSTLACVTNTSISQIPTPRPTRTAVPTFTKTPLPPTNTPVPTATNTPLPDEATATSAALSAALEPTPTEALPPTETPLPTDAPEPTSAPPANPPPANPQPPPATPTPVPPPTPVVEANSPLPTPANTPALGTPSGRYEALKTDNENNCADIGVTGTVKEKANDNPIPNVMVEVQRDDDDDGDNEFRGPFSARTDQNGRYNIYIGPKDDVGRIKWKALVVGDASVISEDEPKWETSSDCRDGDEIQVMEIDWGRKD